MNEQEKLEKEIESYLKKLVQDFKTENDYTIEYSEDIIQSALDKVTFDKSYQSEEVEKY